MKYIILGLVIVGFMAGCATKTVYKKDHRGDYKRVQQASDKGYKELNHELKSY
jgi:uncharacterized lipoprotein